MFEQMPLQGIEPKPPLTDRLIMAALPDAQAIDRIERLRGVVSREHGLRGNAIIPGRLHVSLIGLGDYPGIPGRVITAAGSAANRIDVRAFTVIFDRIMSFAGRVGSYPLVLIGDAGVAGLILLQRRLSDELRRSGLRLKPSSGFTPHLTSLYSPKKIASQPIEPISWRMRDFALVGSRIGMNLPYAVLERWTLEE